MCFLWQNIRIWYRNIAVSRNSINIILLVLWHLTFASEALQSFTFQKIYYCFELCQFCSESLNQLKLFHPQIFNRLIENFQNQLKNFPVCDLLATQAGLADQISLLALLYCCYNCHSQYPLGRVEFFYKILWAVRWRVV